MSNQNTSPKHPSLQYSTSNKMQTSPSSKQIVTTKHYYFEQPSISCNSVSTLSTMHHSNTMGNEPSQVIITIAKPKNQEDNEDLKQHLSPQQHRKPHKIDCKQCGKSGISITQMNLGAGSLIICVLFLMAGCLLFAWIPLCLPDCMDVKHYCPNCGAPAGVSRYLLDA